MTTSVTLATALDQLGVYFVAGQMDGWVGDITPPVVLLRGLTGSDEARMRLALIPLFLTHPEYAQYVAQSLNNLSPDHKQVLRCYYTAAHLLQQKYHSQLTDILGNRPLLPALFNDVLDIDEHESPDGRLRQLSRQQAKLSGRFINWYGTYEHAYARLVRHAARRKQWLS